MVDIRPRSRRWLDLPIIVGGVLTVVAGLAFAAWALQMAPG